MSIINILEILLLECKSELGIPITVKDEIKNKKVD